MKFLVAGEIDEVKLKDMEEVNRIKMSKEKEKHLEKLNSSILLHHISTAVYSCSSNSDGS